MYDWCPIGFIRDLAMKPYARILLILFGTLDIILALRFYRHLQWPGWLFERDMSPLIIALEISRPLLLLSLFVSGYALIQQKKWGLILSYIQFPLRFISLYLSFGLLSMIPGLSTLAGYNNLMIAFVILEVARLIATIVIHINTSRQNRWMAASSPTPEVVPAPSK